MELDERDHETFEEGGRAADAAMYELMKTPPTTLAGMRAIIQYLVDLDDDSGYYYLPTLLRSRPCCRLLLDKSVEQCVFRRPIVRKNHAVLFAHNRPRAQS